MNFLIQNAYLATILHASPFMVSDHDFVIILSEDIKESGKSFIEAR